MREVIMRLTTKPFEESMYAEIVRELIRCKDCVFQRRTKDGAPFCGYEADRCDPYEMTRSAKDDYYCADAERGEDA